MQNRKDLADSPGVDQDSGSANDGNGSGYIVDEDIAGLLGVWRFPKKGNKGLVIFCSEMALEFRQTVRTETVQRKILGSILRVPQ